MPLLSGKLGVAPEVCVQEQQDTPTIGFKWFLLESDGDSEKVKEIETSVRKDQSGDH